MRRPFPLTVLILVLAASGFWHGRGMMSRLSPVPGPPRLPGGGTIALTAGAPAAGSAIAEPPRVYLDTTPITPTGRVITVSAEGRLEGALNALKRAMRLPAGGRLQAALDAARSGDVVDLEAGAAFVGNFILRNTDAGGWITIRSSAHGRLSPAGSRISPAQAGLMPKIVSPNGRPAIRTAPGARNIRLMGLEVAPAPGVFVHSLVELGASDTSPSALPSDIIVDRCYLHGDPAVGSRRGIALNGARLAVIDSYLAGFKEVGADSQAIMGWNGPGPFKIANNYLEGAGENVMFGGDDPDIPDLVPSDIEIRGNDFSKPLSWRRDDPSFAGTAWTVKNLFELKNARRVLVEGNVFEHNWAQTQHGLAIVFTPRNQHGAAPWSVVEDVTFRHNIIRKSTGGFFLLGWDNLRSSRQLRRVLIKDNLFVDIGVFTETSLPNEGVLFLISDGPAEVVIDHNTAVQSGPPIRASVQLAGRWPARGFVFTNNVLFHNQGIGGGGAPKDTLSTYFAGAAFTGNALVGGNPALYPPGNFFPASLDPASLTVFAGGDASHRPASMVGQEGTDGRAVGADLAAIAAAIRRRWRSP